MLRINPFIGDPVFDTELHLETNLHDDTSFQDDTDSIESNSQVDFDSRCSHCKDNEWQEYVWPQVVPLRDGDDSMMKADILTFMMQVRLRRRFPLLELPAEVRFTILRHLLYHHEPLRWRLCDRPENFTFHPEILATCHQLYNEGSVILMHQNTFTLRLYDREEDQNMFQWLGLFYLSRADPATWARGQFHTVKKLEVVIDIYEGDRARRTQMDVESIAEHRGLLYELVDHIQSRGRALSHLNIRYEGQPDQKSVRMYNPDHQGSHEARETEARTAEEYVLEPLANLKGAARQLTFEGMTTSCKDFLESRMKLLEDSTLDRKFKTDYGVYLDGRIDMDVHKQSLTCTASRLGDH